MNWLMAQCPAKEYIRSFYNAGMLLQSYRNIKRYRVEIYENRNKKYL